MLNMPDNLHYWTSKAIFFQNSCNSFEDKTCRQTDGHNHQLCTHIVLYAKNTFNNPVTPHIRAHKFTIWEQWFYSPATTMLKVIMWLRDTKLLSRKREFEIPQYRPAGPCPFAAATMQHMATNDSQLQLTTSSIPS